MEIDYYVKWSSLFLFAREEFHLQRDTVWCKIKDIYAVTRFRLIHVGLNQSLMMVYVGSSYTLRVSSRGNVTTFMEFDPRMWICCFHHICYLCACEHAVSIMSSSQNVVMISFSILFANWKILLASDESIQF